MNNMRYILYLLYVIVYLLFMYFIGVNLEVARSLGNYHIIISLLICADFGFRLKSSKYVFVPVVIAVNFILATIARQVPIEYGQWMLLINLSISLNYMAAAYFLYRKWLDMNANNQNKAVFIIIMALALLPVAVLDLSEELRLLSVSIIPVKASAMALTSFAFNILLLGACGLNVFKNFYSQSLVPERELSLFIGLVALVPFITYLFHI